MPISLRENPCPSKTKEMVHIDHGDRHQIPHHITVKSYCES